MILGATDVDVDFNVNVVTGSDRFINGGSGGHTGWPASATPASEPLPVTTFKTPAGVRP